jgi:hypothetical protein
MKKNIDIPDEIVQDLKILAVKANKDLKNYIQEILISLIKSNGFEKTERGQKLKKKVNRQNYLRSTNPACVQRFPIYAGGVYKLKSIKLYKTKIE